MTKIKCLIVDDEPVAQRILTKYIADFPDMEIIAVCNNAIIAMMVLEEKQVDLIFLDIEMPKIKGVEFAKSLKQQHAIIFTTAHREFAIDGFDLGVLDYLLKPISFQRFFQAIQKYRDTRQSPTVESTELPATLSFKSDRKTHMLSPMEILFIEGMGNYVQLQLKDKKLVVYEKLSGLEATLPNHFIRVHKSYIVNIHHIQAYTAESIEIGTRSIPIGGQFKKTVIAFLESI